MQESQKDMAESTSVQMEHDVQDDLGCGWSTGCRARRALVPAVENSKERREVVWVRG